MFTKFGNLDFKLVGESNLFSLINFFRLRFLLRNKFLFFFFLIFLEDLYKGFISLTYLSYFSSNI